MDGLRLTKDIEVAVAALNEKNYEVVDITPITSGRFNYAHEVVGVATGGAGCGYGYGYSFTDGVVITAKRSGQQLQNEI